MAGFLQFSLVISLSVLFACGYTVQFDDIINDGTNDIRNDFEIKLAVLEQKVIDESLEIQQWRLRIAELEKHLTEVKDDKVEALSRHKRGVHDPNLGMFVGKPGRPGRPGNQGRPGLIGRRGQKGHKGISGPPGLSGPPGPYGPPGWQGPYGFVGAVGIKGEMGESGFDGIPGLIGDVGLVGYNGNHGPMGPPGVLGHTGFIGMTGPPGPRGHIGEVGNHGPPGARGRLGVPGPVGFYGGPGLMGENGFMGPPGILGYNGPKGELGDSGNIGPWGEVGHPGPVYDPYIGIMAAPLMHAAPLRGENCTDQDDGVPNCSSFEMEQMHLAIPYPSKSLPAYRHPPPGAHVMAALPDVNTIPAQAMSSKVQMIYAPPAFSKQYSPAYGHNIEYYTSEDDDTDILSEQDFEESVGTIHDADEIDEMPDLRTTETEDTEPITVNNDEDAMSAQERVELNEDNLDSTEQEITEVDEHELVDETEQESLEETVSDTRIEVSQKSVQVPEITEETSNINDAEKSELETVALME